MTTKRQTEVLIVGGGVIGCAVAYYLSREGVAVTVVEKGRLGSGCSYGNAGWLVPSDITPLPAPGLIGQAARWLGDPDSPLYVKPRFDFEMFGWLAQFLSHANRRHMLRSAPRLAALQNLSLRLLKEFVNEYGAQSIAFEAKGVVYACNTETALATVLEESQLAAEYGVAFRSLSRKDIRTVEPALGRSMVGGVLYETDCHVEPLATVQQLARAASRYGAVMKPQTEVFGFERSGCRVRAVRTTRGRLTAGRVVLCTGSWTPLLTRKLGFPVPVQAGKGYALIVASPRPMPQRPLMLVEKKIAVTPRQNTLRLCGTMELAGLDESVTFRRVTAIERGAREFLCLPTPLEPVEIWRGLRPCTPDGLPLLGPAPGFDNLFVAAGHAMIGLSTAAGTGRVIADLCLDRQPPLDLRPFALSRFCR